MTMDMKMLKIIMKKINMKMTINKMMKIKMTMTIKMHVMKMHITMILE